MMLLLPAFLGAATLTGIPVVLHFLRRKPQEQIPFPTLRFLGPTALRETRRNRIRRWITLILRCLVVTLLALGFARPFFAANQGRGKRAMVVAIDNSYSMQTKDRWEALQKWAVKEVDQLREGDRAGVLLINPTPTWLVPMTENRSTVRDAVVHQQPGFQTTRYNPSLRTAGAVLADTPGSERTILWMADEQRLGWAGVNLDIALPPGVKLESASTAGPVKNQAAITQVSAQTTNGKAEVEITVRLYEPATAQRTLTVSVNHEDAVTRKLELSKEKPTVLKVPLEGITPPAAITARLDSDDLPADDIAYAAIDTATRTKVLLTNAPAGENSADFLGHAIESMREIETQPMDRLSLPDSVWPSQSVAVLRGNDPFRASSIKLLEDHLSRGGAAWIWVDGSPDQLAWLKKQGIQATQIPERVNHLQGLDLDHPVIGFFEKNNLLPLLELEFRQTWSLQSPTLESMARWNDQSIAIGEQTIGGGRVLLCGFPPTRIASDWPAQASFVPFVHQALASLSNAVIEKRSWKVGERISLANGPGEWKAVESSRTQSAVPVREFVSPTVPGVYQYSANGKNRLFAVNLATEESDLTPLSDESALHRLESNDSARTISFHSSRLAQTDAEQKQALWWWLLAAAGVLLLGELALANRTAL